jgi:hypothetical protein
MNSRRSGIDVKLAAFRAVLFWFAAAIVAQAAPLPMRPYTIELPGQVLHFALPEEIARGMPPMKVEKRFDLQDPSFVKNGFREVAGWLHQLNGPIWVGAYGCLKFHFMIQKRKPEYKGDITTVEGLDHYVHWWELRTDNKSYNWVFSRSALNGAPAVRREWSTFGEPGRREPEYQEIFSLPLDQEIFLDVGFNVREWEGGRLREGMWKAKAEALREAIKATVVLERRPPGDTAETK